MALGWGISGTGDIINKAVAPALVAIPEADLVSFYSRTPARAEAFAEKFGAARAHSDWTAFLAEPDIDAVYVGGEVDRHCPETIAAAEAGKHVVCEKPMALNADECRRMIDACEANGVHLAIAYYRRYYPQVLKLKELLDAGTIGTLLQASVQMSSNYAPSTDDPKYWRVGGGGGGGALMDIGSHRLDVLCWLLGEPARVAGLASHRVHDYAASDTESLLCELADGAHLLLRCTWCAGGNQDDLQLVGSEGVLLVGALEDTSFVLRQRGQPDQTIEVEPVAANRHEPFLADVTRRLLAGQPPRHDGRAGYQASRIMDGCYRSQQTGRMVEV